MLPIIPSRLVCEPLRLEHLDALEPIIRNAKVYRHIGGEPPDAPTFHLGMARALAGPQPHQGPQVWLNYLVRRRTDQAVLGRLEATVHDGIAEVAFLFGPQYWGQGYATEGLLWLNQQLLQRPDCHALWATTIAANVACQKLLVRCGYDATTAHWPERLLTYDEGDHVYRGPSK